MRALNKLLKWARRRPFQAFEVILDSGTKIPVRHPEEIFFLPDPARIEDILVYAEEDEYVFGPEAVSAVLRHRETRRG